MGGQVDIDIMGAVDAAHQLAVVIQRLGVLFLDEMLHGGKLHALGNAGKDALVQDLVLLQRGLVGGHKLPVQLDQVKHIAGLHQQQELFLGHHLAELAVAGIDLAGLVVPGLGDLRQLVGGLVADVDLVGPIGQRLVKGADMSGQLLQIFALRVHDALRGLGGAVPQDHIGGVGQNIAGALDYTFQFVHDLSFIS